MSWPTADKPKDIFVSTRFDGDEAAELDAAVSIAGAPSRSAYIRECVRRCRAADKRKAERLKQTGSESAGVAL